MEDRNGEREREREMMRRKKNCHGVSFLLTEMFYVLNVV
jgi:hypothetical protein